MDTSGLRDARDYNRGLSAPIRWAHVAAAVTAPILRPLRDWAGAPARRAWAPRLLMGAILFVILLPLDGPIARWLGAHQLGGDLRRELEALQQYGQAFSSLLIAAVIWIQDPVRRRRLADWAAAFILTWLAVFGTKTLIGRPRPKFDDPWRFLGPFGQYPVSPTAGVRHAWELWGGISSDLWSIPSAHTAYACVMAVFLSALYPRLRWIVWSLAALVGAARILTRAHYPSDVVAGWLIGTTVATLAVSRSWGVAFLDRRASAPTPARPDTPTPCG
jgi:membrane-associated phospholipid phosphatase